MKEKKDLEDAKNQEKMKKLKARQEMKKIHEKLKKEKFQSILRQQSERMISGESEQKDGVHGTPQKNRQQKQEIKIMASWSSIERILIS